MFRGVIVLWVFENIVFLSTTSDLMFNIEFGVSSSEIEVREEIVAEFEVKLKELLHKPGESDVVRVRVSSL